MMEHLSRMRAGIENNRRPFLPLLAFVLTEFSGVAIQQPSAAERIDVSEAVTHDLTRVFQLYF
jgi:hypothetical protein